MNILLPKLIAERDRLLQAGAAANTVAILSLENLIAEITTRARGATGFETSLPRYTFAGEVAAPADNNQLRLI